MSNVSCDGAVSNEEKQRVSDADPADALPGKHGANQRGAHAVEAGIGGNGIGERPISLPEGIDEIVADLGESGTR